jgi:hypothetical protein
MLIYIEKTITDRSKYVKGLKVSDFSSHSILEMRYNWYHTKSRNRLRKRKKELALPSYQGTSRYNSLRVYHSSTTNRNRNDPLWGGLHRAWVGYVIGKSQCDCEKMRKYAIAIQKFERLLNIEINEFPEIGLYTYDAFEDKEEDEDSKLAVINPLTNEKIQEAKEDDDDYVRDDRK